MNRNLIYFFIFGVVLYATELSAQCTPPDLSNTSSVAANCDNSDGQATVTPSGAVSPYTFNWGGNAGNQTTPTANNLAPGSYFVTVTDNTGCSSITAILVGRNAPQITVNQMTPATCKEANDGAFDITVNGGTTPYSFDWVYDGEPYSNNQDLSNLQEGMYYVTVTDNIQCTHVDSVLVTYDIGVAISDIFTIQQSCEAIDGQATVGLIGVGNYAFNWERFDVPGISISTDSIIANRPAGFYNVTVTANNICSTVSTIQIPPKPTPEIIDVDIIPAGCSEGQGSISIHVANGVPSYSYTWESVFSPGTILGTDSILTNLSGGVYEVTVTNFDTTCIVIEQFVVPYANPPSLDTIRIDTADCDVANGAAHASFEWGIPPYNYVWVSGQDTISMDSFIANVPAGNYDLYVSNFGGVCERLYQVIVPSFGGPKVDSVFITNETCGLSDGIIDVRVSGGAQPYNFTWSDGNSIVGTNPSLSGVPAGNYELNLTNNDGSCAFIQHFTLEDFSTIEITGTESTAEGCNQGGGTATVIVESDSTNHEFVWYNASGDIVSIDSVATDLSAGVYTCEVSYVGGACKVSANVSVRQGGGITPVFPFIFNTTCGKDNGQAAIKLQDGTAPFEFEWFDVDGNTLSLDSLITDLSYGNYSVSVKDAVGCNFTQYFQIADSEGVLVEMRPDTTMMLGDSVELFFAINDSSVVIRWDPPVNISCVDCFRPIVNPSETTTYSLIVQDSIGCVDTASVLINIERDAIGLWMPNAFTPNNDQINDVIYPNGMAVKNISYLRIYNRWGQKVYEANDFNANDPTFGWDGNFKGKMQDSGVYYYTLEVQFLDLNKEYYSGAIELIR